MVRRAAADVYKKPAGGPSYPTPKKGKLRTELRLSAKARKSTKTALYKSVPYVPKKQQVNISKKTKIANQTWSMSLASLAKLSPLQTIRALRKVGILPTWSKCPWCKGGRVTDLRRGGRGRAQRCEAREPKRSPFLRPLIMKKVTDGGRS